MQRQLFAMPAQIPDDIARMAHEQKLGAPQADYTVGKLARGWRWRNPILFLILSVMLVLILTAAFLLLFYSDSEASMNMSSSLLTYIGLCQGLFSVGIAFSVFVYTSYHLYPCGEAIILKQSKRKFRTIRWNEVESIWRTFAHTPDSVFTRQCAYKIHCHDGYTLTFSGKPGEMDELDKIIEAQFTQRLLPTYIADYQAGHTLNFGLLTLDLNGLSAHGKVLAWEQITKVSLRQNRHLVVSSVSEQQKPWLNIQAFKIPNLMILLSLVEQVRTGQTMQEAKPKLTEPLMTYGASTTIVPAMHGAVSPLPDEISALADEHQLGERRIDERLGLSRIVSWPMIIIMFILLTLCIIFGNWMFGSWLATPYDSGWMLVFENTVRIVTLLSCAVGGLLFLFPWVKHVNHYTYTFANGLILKHGRKAPVICRWDEIEAVWHVYKRLSDQSAGITSSCTLQLHEGTKYSFSALDINRIALGKILKEQVTPLQLPKFLSAYQDRQTLAFGPVRINQQGIALDTRLLPWSQVKSVSLEGNKLVIYDIAQRKPWGKLPAKRVPNLFVLFALADRARR